MDIVGIGESSAMITNRHNTSQNMMEITKQQTDIKGVQRKHHYSKYDCHFPPV